MFKKMLLKLSVFATSCFLLVGSLTGTVGVVASAAVADDESTWTATESDFSAEKDPVSEYAYSFAVVGDQQCVTNLNPDNLHYIYDYILDNQAAKKIEYVFNLGDVTENSTDWEWELAMTQFQRLDGVVPYSVVRGNHDTLVSFEANMANTTYLSQFEGFYVEGEASSVYRTFTVGGTDYLMLNLAYGASDGVLNWAGSVVSRFPEHKVIVSTHCVLYRDGTFSQEELGHHVFQTARNEYNDGEAIWEKFLSRYENIFLVLSGHISATEIVTQKYTGVHGNTVTCMLIDPQWDDNYFKDSGGLGLVAMLYFSENGEMMEVEYISTIRAAEGKAAYYREVNQFSVSFLEEPAEEETHTCVASQEWVKNATHHWNVCMGENCSEELNKAEHTFGEWEETLAPTKDSEGRKERSCTVCNYTEATTVPKKTSGCNASIGSSMLCVGTVLLLGTVVYIEKKKNKQED